MYVIERIAATMLGYITILAIIISCLGLIGLSTFMTVRRTKEIGIRKVNGAKSIEIFYMLSKEYVVLVIISFLIASPIAWYGHEYVAAKLCLPDKHRLVGICFGMVLL